MSAIPQYFLQVSHTLWTRDAFIAAGNPGFHWLECLRTIEDNIDTYGAVKAARAGALLDQDAHDTYFMRVPPKEWSSSDFERVTSRSSAWSWAIGQVLHGTMFTEEQAREAIRAKTEAIQQSNVKRSKSSSPEPNAKKSKRAKPKAKTPNPNPKAKPSTPIPDPNARPKIIPSWVLPSGTVVEDILARKDPRQLAQMSIIDLSDASMPERFLDDWGHITTIMKPRPTPRAIQAFGNLDSIPAIVPTLLSSDDRFDRWVGAALNRFCGWYRDAYFSQPPRERTFDVIWSSIIDDGLIGTGFFVTRGERQSSSFMELNNENREPEEPINGGLKFDGIIGSYHNSFEYGFLEVSNLTERPFHTKASRDMLKIVRAMRTSFVHFSKHVTKDDLRDLELLSIQTSGRIMRVSRMCYGGGNVLLLQREPEVEIPMTFDAEKFRQLLLAAAFIRDVLSRNTTKVPPVGVLDPTSQLVLVDSV